LYGICLVAIVNEMQQGSAYSSSENINGNFQNNPGSTPSSVLNPSVQLANILNLHEVIDTKMPLLVEILGKDAPTPEDFNAVVYELEPNFWKLFSSFSIPQTVLPPHSCVSCTPSFSESDSSCAEPMEV